MSISTGTILKVVASLLWSDGNVAQNVFNSLISGGAGPWDEEDVVADALAWVDAMYTTYEGHISSALSGSQIQVYKWDTVGTDWDEIGSDTWTFVGTAASEELPRGVAGLLNAKTSDPDVSGKKYLPGITEASLSLGLWVVEMVADMVDFGADWVVPFVGATSGADWTPGIWSVVNEALYEMSLTVVIPTIPAYQRRRKRGVGI